MNRCATQIKAALVDVADLVDAAHLVDATHYENHPWAEGGDVAVVVHQGGDGGVVRGGDR